MLSEASGKWLYSIYVYLSPCLYLGFLWSVLSSCWLPCISVMLTCPVWNVSFVSSSVLSNKGRFPEDTVEKVDLKRTFDNLEKSSSRNKYLCNRELCNSSISWVSAFICQNLFLTHFSNMLRRHLWAVFAERHVKKQHLTKWSQILVSDGCCIHYYHNLVD